jgi:hypothetical protein
MCDLRVPAAFSVIRIICARKKDREEIANISDRGIGEAAKRVQEEKPKTEPDSCQGLARHRKYEQCEGASGSPTNELRLRVYEKENSKFEISVKEGEEHTTLPFAFLRTHTAQVNHLPCNFATILGVSTKVNLLSTSNAQNFFKLGIQKENEE